MKNLLLLLLLIPLSLITHAQSNTITGTVKDEQGNPLHYVFVLDEQAKNAVFTDSLGNFSITGNLVSKLHFNLAGHEGKTVDVADKAALQVVLKSTDAAGSGNTPTTISAQITTTNTNALATIGDGGVIAPTHQKGELRGSMYLFKTFVHGYIITSAGVVTYNPDYLFDYDKMGGALLLTQDKQTITEVPWDQTQSFIVYSNGDERLVFEKAPGIDPSHYVQVLASGKKYKIYKLIKTKFVKSDYVNGGIVSHGTDFDEYVDDADYYLWDVQANQPQKLLLKKKSIKEDFAKEADKINKYLTDNSGRINETYLSKLGDYMNQ
jgi:hypothetical protein